jgi:hypothetical protein
VTFTKVRERAFEPTDIHHPLHPLHHLVLDELEEWVEADEGWQDFPDRPTNCTRWNDGNPRRLHGN